MPTDDNAIVYVVGIKYISCVYFEDKRHIIVYILCSALMV